MTNEEVDLRIADRPIRRIGEYVNSHSNILWECHNTKHSQWPASPGNIMKGTGCPTCAGNTKNSVESLNSVIGHRGLFITPESMKSMRKPCEITCLCGNSWITLPSNVMRGRGCPQCADYRFKIELDAWLYLVEIELDGEMSLGFGISNHPRTRIRDHRRNVDDLRILAFWRSDGKTIQALEATLKQNHAIVGSAVGFKTETLSPEFSMGQFHDLASLMGATVWHGSYD